MNALADIKTTIKSFENSITDQGITAFEENLSLIRKNYKNTPSVTTVLKMMQALGKYIGKKKQDAHPDSMVVMDSLAAGLDKLISTPYLDTDEVSRIVTDEIEKYRVFQKLVVPGPPITTQDMDTLKEVILAIDWEISDTTLSNFESALTELLDKTREFKIHHTFLKIMYAIGRQIGIEKAGAPADSITFLRTLLEHFQQVTGQHGMGSAEKRQLLEKDILKFNSFSKSVSPDQKSAETPVDDDLPEVMPALSHIKPASGDSGEDLPLTELTDDEDPTAALMSSASGSGSVAGSPAPAASPQQDIMGDLFSMKESPADELLDAIHLMEVHGEKGQERAMEMLDGADEGEQGLKNFTPGRKDTVPIPEIGSRLDEFFSLDSPSDTAGELADTFPEADSAAEMDVDDTIVPFDTQDEGFGEEFSEEFDEKEAEEQMIPDDVPQSEEETLISRLEQLKISIEEGRMFQERDELVLFQNEISQISTALREDPLKAALIDLVSLSVNSASKFTISEISFDESTVPKNDTGDLSISDPDHSDAELSEQEIPELEPEDKSSMGIWAKIKSRFSK